MKIFLPNLSVKNINYINWKFLKESIGIKYLVFDKDDTLTLNNTSEINKILKFDTFKEIFFNFERNVFLCSNNKKPDLKMIYQSNLKKIINYELRNGNLFDYIILNLSKYSFLVISIGNPKLKAFPVIIIKQFMVIN